MGYGNGGSYRKSSATLKAQSPERQRRYTFGTHSNAAHVWAQQQAETHTGQSSDGRMRFEGPTIYSYGHHYAIAHFTGKKLDGRAIVFFERDNYSNSTSKHRGHVRGALRGLPVIVCDVPELTKLISSDAKWDKKAHKRRVLEAYHNALENVASAERAAPTDWRTQEQLTADMREAREELKAVRRVLRVGGNVPRNVLRWSDERAAEAERAANAEKLKDARDLIAQPLVVSGMVEELAEEPRNTWQANDDLRQVTQRLTQYRSARLVLGKMKAGKAIRARASQLIKQLEPYAKQFQERADKATAAERHEKDLEALKDIAAFYAGTMTYRPAALNCGTERIAYYWAKAIAEGQAELAAKLGQEVQLARWNAEVPATFKVETYGREVITAEEWRAGKGSAHAAIAGMPGYSFRGDTPTLIRRKGDRLETSRGAECPWSHAVMAYRVAENCRRHGVQWETNGHTLRVGHFKVDRIAPDGTLTAGCHTLAWEEISALAVREIPELVKPCFPLPAVVAS